MSATCATSGEQREGAAPNSDSSYSGKRSGEDLQAALRFEIVNPSDPYTFTAPTLEIAALVVCLLGEGKYGGTSLDTPRGVDVPIFIFGGHDEWFKEQFGCTFEDSYERTDKLALADSFDTVTLGRAERSSMNNIGGRAKRYAKALRGAAIALAAKESQ
jgi:hypothetical protein